MLKKQSEKEKEETSAYHKGQAGKTVQDVSEWRKKGLSHTEWEITFFSKTASYAYQFN